MRANERWSISISTALVVASVAAPTAAATKEECVEAHGFGQDLRERGELIAARRAFLACAQASCPNMVQADCAKWGEETDRATPTLTFSARDERGADLPDTEVYLDGTPLLKRLDDGRPVEIDPGKHAFRFVHGSRSKTIDVVTTQGEKGRTVSVVFDRGAPAPSPEPTASVVMRRSAGPLVFAGVGVAVAAVGVVLTEVALAQLPDTCSLSTHDCAAPPGDPVFSRAQTSVTLANVGIGIGIGGVVMLAVGLVWYFAAPKHRVEALGPVLRF